MDALAMVVNRHRELLLGAILADHVLVQVFLYFQRLRKLVRRRRGQVGLVILEDGVANGNALIANIGSRIIAGGGNQLTDNILTLMAKRTPQCIIRSGTLHTTPPAFFAGLSPRAPAPVLNSGRLFM